MEVKENADEYSKNLSTDKCKQMNVEEYKYRTPFDFPEN